MVSYFQIQASWDLWDQDKDIIFINFSVPITIYPLTKANRADSKSGILVMASNSKQQNKAKGKVGRKMESQPTPKCADLSEKRESSPTEDGGASSTKRQKSQFTFFYGANTPFSQFHPADFEVDGVQYTCAEMYMMHQKAVLFGDTEIAAEILVAAKPAAMKALGRKVRDFNEETWKQSRREIVKKGNMAKFLQNPELLAALMATSGTTLVEASPRDRIWGIGLGANNPKAQSKHTWRGQNLLGYILTEVRDELESRGDGQT